MTHATRSTTPPPPGRADRGGFSLVELVVAVLILSIGVLGLAGTTAVVIRQVTLADVNTERSAALQTVVEEIRATPYDNLNDGSRVEGAFKVSWDVEDASGQTKSVQVVTTGPGLSAPGGSMPVVAPAVQDTFSFMVLRP